MVSRKNVDNRHTRKRNKKNNIDELMSYISLYFTSKTRSRKDQNKNRKRRNHRIESISKEVATTLDDNDKSKKALSEFIKEKPVEPIYLHDILSKDKVKEDKQVIEPITIIDKSINEQVNNLITDKKRSRNNRSYKAPPKPKEHYKSTSELSLNKTRKASSKKIKLSTFKIREILKYNNFNLRTKALVLMCLCSLGFILFYLIPFIFSIYYSLINNAFDKNFVGIKNYIEVIQNHYFRLALKNTFQFTFIGVGILVPVSFVLAIIIVNLTKSMNFVKPAFFIPMLLPTASVIIIWKILFGDYSYINEFLNNDTGRLPIYLLFLWKNCGYNIILFSAAFLSVDKFIYEAASLDGVNVFQKHLYITFPLILPTVFFIFIISLVNSFKIFKEVYLFYGTLYPEQNLYLVQHYMKNHFDKLNYQNLTTGAIIFAIMVYIIVAIGYKFQEKVSTEA